MNATGNLSTATESPSNTPEEAELGWTAAVTGEASMTEEDSVIEADSAAMAAAEDLGEMADSEGEIEEEEEVDEHQTEGLWVCEHGPVLVYC